MRNKDNIKRAYENRDVQVRQTKPPCQENLGKNPVGWVEDPLPAGALANFWIFFLRFFRIFRVSLYLELDLV